MLLPIMLTAYWRSRSVQQLALSLSQYHKKTACIASHEELAILVEALCPRKLQQLIRLLGPAVCPYMGRSSKNAF